MKNFKNRNLKCDKNSKSNYNVANMGTNYLIVDKFG